MNQFLSYLQKFFLSLNTIKKFFCSLSWGVLLINLFLGNQPHTWNQISYQCNQVLVMEHSKLKQAYEQEHISHSNIQPTKDMITSDLFSSTDERIENLPSERVLFSSPC